MQFFSDVEFIKVNKRVIFFFAVCLTPHCRNLSLHQYERMQFDETVEMFLRHLMPPSSRQGSHSASLESAKCNVS